MINSQASSLLCLSIIHIVSLSAGIYCSIRHGHVLRIRPSRRTAKAVVTIGHSVRCRKQEQTWLVRFSIRGRSISSRSIPVPLRCIPVRRITVCRHFVRHFPVRVFTLRSSISPERRCLVVPVRRQNLCLSVHLLPVRTLFFKSAVQLHCTGSVTIHSSYLPIFNIILCFIYYTMSTTMTQILNY